MSDGDRCEQLVTVRSLARTGGQGTILPQIAAERHAAGCGLEQFGATPVHCAKCEHEGSAA